MDLYFIADVAFNIRTAYYDENGELVVDAQRIWKRYFAGWFWIDLVSCLPVSYVGMIADSSDMQTTGARFKMLKALRLLRLIKLLRMRARPPASNTGYA